MKRFAMIVLLLMAVAIGFSASVDIQTIERVANNFALERWGEGYQVQYSLALESNHQDSYIRVVVFKPKGFALVAADDAAMPIIGYSIESNWGDADIPPQMQFLMDGWIMQMQAIVSQRMAPTVEIQHEWSRYSVATARFSPDRNYRDVSPLVNSIWGQGTYYNAQCPSGTPVGCVATAMSQIMRYWRYPTIGQGSHSYTCNPYGTQSADFGSTTYNWAAMPASVTSTNTSVATICRHAGVAVDMQYAPDGSGAYSEDVPAALINYFRYSNTAQIYNKSSYSSNTWDTMMRGEIDNSRPVYYSGSGPAGGHAFVIDGYQGTSSFHVNWGWNGSYNGYFTLNALNPGGDTFNVGQQAVMGIKPGSMTLNLSEGFEGTTFPPTGWTVTASTFARSTTNYISGAYSARYNATATGANQSGKQLRTTKLTVNASSPALVFKARAGTTARSEQIKVGYSTTGSAPFTYFPTNASLTTSAQTFTYATSGLTPGDYYFVLETYCSLTNSASRTWIIDDITGPALWVNPNPIASLNISSWAAGALAPGDASYSDDIFQLSNTGQGTLTITSITNLSGTEFTTNFNTSTTLVNGQVYEFGFSYQPVNYGTDNQSFQIVTNAGTVTISLSGSATYSTFYDGFENYSDFSLTCSPWTQYDGDGLTQSSGMSSPTWQNSSYTGSWMIFNPGATSPSMSASYPAYMGAKFASCWYATANNDWLITPQLNLSSAGTVSFYARALSATYPETMNVKYSTTTNDPLTAFTNTLASNLSVSTATWTLYSYSIPINCKYIAIQCVSADAWALWVDEFKVVDSSTPAPPSFGNISGYVFRYGTSTPVVNAKVTAGTKIAYTDNSGFYLLSNMLVGSHTVSCNADGQFYFSVSQSGVTVTQGNTTTQDFNLTWGELTANPQSISASLYQGENGSANVVLANPGGTASTTYAGYIASASQSRSSHLLLNNRKKPSPETNGTPIPPITVSSNDRTTGWFGYASIDDAEYITSALTERGNYFIVDDIAMMDGNLTLSQLRHYFYNPSSSAWTSTTNKFKWKVYTVSSTGTVTLVHTSAEITLPTTTPTNTYLLSTYTIPTAITVPVGTDFIVSILPSSTSTGKPQSLATSVYADNGLIYDATNGWQDLGMDLLLDVYVNGTSWLNGASFSGTIAPGATASIPLNFTTTGVSAGTKHANMYIYNNSNYVAPSALDRGDVLVVPISLTITVATTPVAVLQGSDWTTTANVGTPSSSGDVFTLSNVGPGNLTISSVTGLSGTPFTSNINLGMSLAQNTSSSFGFTFNPTSSGIYTTTVQIVTNGGTKTITLTGYANYISESFEGAVFPPDGWVANDVDADTYNWMQYTATDAAHTGTNCAGSASYINDSKNSGMRSSFSRAALTPNNWLITPRLAISSGDIMSYWIAAQDGAWPAEHYAVMLSTTTNQTASFTTTLYSETLSSATWLQRTIDLSAYAGQNVYIAFRHYDCTDQFVLKLDDVLLPPLAAPLVFGNISGTVYKAGTSTFIQGATVAVAGRTVDTDEYGSYTISNIVVDTYPITATATGYINYSSSVTIPANTTLTHNIYLDYANVSTAETTYNTNVNVGGTTSINVLMTNNGNATLEFETASGIWGGYAYPNGALNQTWETEDLTGWAGSVAANSDIYGSASTPYGYNSNNTWVFAANANTEVQYLISPKLRVGTGDALSFWYKQFNASTESFEVRISTTDNLLASFTTLASIGPLADQNWANYNQSLSAYEGQDIYVMFFYPRVDGYQYGYVFIDDITGPVQIVPPTSWLSCTPTDGTLAAGASRMLTLNIDATTLPVGTYTAQTWVFSNGLVSPYKLYVTANVQAASAPDAPVVSGIEAFAGGIGISWEEVANAVVYKVYACDTPDGTYTQLGTSENPYIEFTDAELQSAGLSAKAFFKVTADSESRAIVTVSRAAKAAQNSQPIGLRNPKNLPLNIKK